MTEPESRITSSRHQPSLSEITLEGLNDLEEDQDSEEEEEEEFQDASSQEQHLDPKEHPNIPSRANNVDADQKQNQNGKWNSAAALDSNLDDDTPPAFPSLNSHQRSSASRRPNSSNQSTTINNNSNSSSITSSTSTNPTSKSSTSSLRSVLGIPSVPSSSASNLLVPPRTTALTAPPGVGGASGANLRTNAISAGSGLGLPGGPPKKERKKVALAPGCSPLDWAKMKKEQDLRVSTRKHFFAASVTHDQETSCDRLIYPDGKEMD